MIDDVMHIKRYDTLKNVLFDDLKKHGGTCALFCKNTEIELLILCPNNYANQLKFFLDTFIIDLITTDYKKEFINKTLPEINKIKYGGLILNALSNFDYEYDAIQIIKKLIYKNELRIKEFIAFKLTELTKKWKEICDITKQNISYLKNDIACQELLKFLIKNTTPKNKEITVKYENNKFVLLNEKLSIIKETTNDSLLEELVLLAPKLLKINCKNISENNNKIINQIFVKSVDNEKAKY